MMDFNNLTNAQRLVLAGQIGVLLGTMLISLGTLLSMSEPPNQPMFGSVGAGGSIGNGNNSAHQYFF
jgi:uncharacterized membrane protein